MKGKFLMALVALAATASAQTPDFMRMVEGDAVPDFEYVWALLQRTGSAELADIGLSEQQAQAALAAVPSAKEVMTQRFAAVQLQACNNKATLEASKTDIAALLDASETESDTIRRDAVNSVLAAVGPELAAKLKARARAGTDIGIGRVDHAKYLEKADASEVRRMVESLCQGRDVK